jgi:hypothetical protein
MNKAYRRFLFPSRLGEPSYKTPGPTYEKVRLNPYRQLADEFKGQHPAGFHNIPLKYPIVIVDTAVNQEYIRFDIETDGA